MDGYLYPDRPLGDWREAVPAALSTVGVNLAGTAALRAVSDPGSRWSRYAPLLVSGLQFAVGAMLKRPVLASMGLATGAATFALEYQAERQAKRLLGR